MRQSSIRPVPYPVTDIHVHINPWAQLLPVARRLITQGVDDARRIEAVMSGPGAVLEHMDAAGIHRIGLINYVSKELMGFDATVNPWVADFVRSAPDRLLAFGGIDPRDPATARDPRGAIDHLLELGIRGLKLHPPHQQLRANSYRKGVAEEHLPTLGKLYARAVERRLPLMLHTGTSVFEGARSRYGHPMDCDDVAVDFPELVLILAHAGRPLWCPEAVFLARRHTNVYLDLSGIPPKRLLHYLPELPRIANKCLWGTDWPGPGIPGLGENLQEFLGLGLDEESQRLVLHDVAAKLFP